MVNDFLEEWTGSNPNWTYDGEEDFTTYAGFLSTAGTSCDVVFAPQPASFFPYPRVPTIPYPLIFRTTFRALCSGVVNTSISQMVVSTETDFSGDYIFAVLLWQVGEPNYFIEVFGHQTVGDFDRIFDTGVARSGDQEIALELIISPSGYVLNVNGSPGDFLSGFNFDSMGYLALNIQRHDISNMGMLASTEIKTDEVGATFDLISPPDGAVSILGNVVFSWEPYSGTIIYQLEISETPDFTNYTFISTHETSAVASIPIGQVRYWRVNAGTLDGNVYSNSYRLIRAQALNPAIISTHEQDGKYRLIYQFREDQ